jgi:futalosine hydrolase
MKLLIVSATSLEIEPLLSYLGKGKILSENLSRYISNKWTIDILITGVGMVATTFWVGKTLAGRKYDFCINAGICGSFDLNLELGSVVNVVEDSFPEKGAESGEYFLSLVDLKLIDKDEFPFSGGKLINSSAIQNEIIDKLLKVKALTVNTVHGNTASITRLMARTQADIETMEGAAFFYVTFQYRIPCLQIRAISNFVEHRNMGKWQIPLAIKNLNQLLARLINE